MIKEKFDGVLRSLFDRLGFSSTVAAYAAETVYALAVLLLCVGAYLVAKLIVVRLTKKAAARSKWINLLLGSNTLLKALKLIPAVVLYQNLYAAPLLAPLFEILLLIFIVMMSLSLINSFLSSVNLIYDAYYPQAKAKPIKGMLSVVKILLFAVAVIIVLSRLLGQSPVYILTGLGALSAVTMLIFKDSILGFVAGFQMSANDLVRIGDWIEMPKYGADGDVIDITLTFVKVRNWDKTIVTIPAYALVSDSFKNWRGMFASGGRRIKRSINIDVQSVGFCSDELVRRLSEIDYIKDYLEQRQQEIDLYNAEKGVNAAIPVNGRHLTNIGIFRRYVLEYLKRHSGINQEMLLIVRQLQNENTGIPLEIYAFTNDTRWVYYEGIMSDIFDHIYAAVPYFDLKVFQEPSGSDMRHMAGRGTS